MSTRYMRKVYGQNEQELKCESEIDSEEDVPIGSKPKSFNVFNLLNENSDNDEENVDEVEEKQLSNEESEQSEQEVEQTEQETKRKKKKKRNKKSQKSKVGDESVKDDTDEIEEIVQTVNKLLGEPKPSTSKENTDVKNWSESCLTVQHKHLNPYNELKKIFGSKTVSADQNRIRTRGRTTNHLKKTWLVVPKEMWKPNNKNWISMTIDIDKEAEFKDGIRYFKFEHSPAYKEVQKEFINAVRSFNPENLINIINKYGFHIDTFIQLSEYFKMSEDLPNAALLIEKALYYLECAFHPLFNMTTANCRVDYVKQQNRALFIILFKHMLFVGNKACYRTSLELCKFLLSLDPYSDPLAAVLIIDFYALRAKEYEWLIKFYKYWDSTRNLNQLPNMAYNIALANFYLGNNEEADKLLQYALMMFPGVLVPLMDKCGISMDSKVTSHDFFTLTADQTTPAALEKLQILYIARCYNFWKEPDVLKWLAHNSHEVLNQIDSKENATKHSEMIQQRCKRYQGLPPEVGRHFILSDVPNVTINAQMSQEERSMSAHDPLPPLNSINIYNFTVNTVIEDWQNILMSYIESFHLMNQEGNVLNGERREHEEID